MTGVLEKRIELAGLRIELNHYDLTEGWEVESPGPEHCLTHILHGPRNLGYARTREFARSPTAWGQLGFAAAGMPAVFRTGEGRLAACLFIFPTSKAEALIEEPVRWRFDDLGSYINIKNRALLHGMQRLRDEVLNPGVAHQQMVEAIGASMVIELCRRFATRQERWAAYRSKLAPWQLRRIKDYVQEHACSAPISPSVLASLCGISASHLARCFKHTTGLTLHAFIESVRIERARMLLAGSELPLGAVAEACGYGNQSYFSTAFRRVTGEAPSGFRARSRTTAW